MLPVIRALGIAGLCLGFVGYLYGRASGDAHQPASRPQTPAGVTPREVVPSAAPTRHSASGDGVAAMARDVPAPVKLALVDPAPRPGESAYDTRVRVEAVADWERFRAEAHLTDEQAAAILRIVYDAQTELAGATEEGWRVLSQQRTDFAKYESDKLETMQADLDAHVRALLTDEQAEAYQDDFTIDVGRLELIGGLVAAQR